MLLQVSTRGGNNEEVEEEEPETKSSSKMSRKQMLLLSIAYAANIGGTGVLTGSPPNLVLPEKLKDSFGPSHPLSFFNWMLFSVPLMILNLVLAFLWLSLYQWLVKKMTRDNNDTDDRRKKSEQRMTRAGSGRRNGDLALTSESQDDEADRSVKIRSVIEEQYKSLGAWTSQEITVVVCFSILLALWFFRDPKIFPGWASLFTYQKVRIGDATTAILMVLVAFSLPTHYRFWPFQPSSQTAQPSPALLQWSGDRGVERRLQWGVILLLGGGFALSEGCEKSGLSIWVGSNLSGLLTSPVLSSFLICLITAGITEFASNTATANILIPILVNTSRELCLNPIYLSFVSTLACSYAFMLPAATAPNAIVKGAANIPISEMMKVGFVMNMICVSTTVLMINTLGRVIFSFDEEMPAWLTDSDAAFAACAATNGTSA